VVAESERYKHKQIKDVIYTVMLVDGKKVFLYISNTSKTLVVTRKQLELYYTKVN
jgi:hypothetical protein